MTLRNVPKSFTLEEQRQEVNEIAVDLDTAVDGAQTFGGSKTFSSDVTFSSTVDFDDIATFNSSPTFSDGVAANFGDDADLKIYYDGSVGVLTSFIDSDALQIRSESDTSELYATFLKDGPVELYHNGVKKFGTNLTGATVLGDLEVNDELHSASGSFIIKTADQITAGQMVTEAVFGGSMYVPYGFDTYPISDFPGGGINETSTNAGFSVSNGGQIYIANISAQALWKGRQVGTPGLTSEIDAAGNAEFAGTVTGGAFAGPLTGNVTGNASGTAGSTGVLSAGATGADLTLSGNLTSAGTVTSTTANNTYAFEVKNGSTNIGGLYRSGTSDTRLILKNVSGTSIVLKGSDGSITADSITSTGSVSFGDTLDLPNANTYITGAGHNVLQVDATRSYFYGGTNGLQLRKADNSSEIVTIDDDGNSVFFGDLSLNDDTKKLTTQIIDPVTPGSSLVIGSTDSAATISFQSPLCVFDEIAFGPTGGLKLGIASGSLPTGATNAVLKTYLDGEFTATCDNSITLNVAGNKLQWTRIGNLITVMGQIQIDSSNGGSALTINNLPYASYNTGDGAGYAVGAVRLYNAPIAANHNYVICMTDIGTTNLMFLAVRDNTTSEALPTADGAYYAFSITYRAA